VGPTPHVSSWRVCGLMDEIMILSPEIQSRFCSDYKKHEQKSLWKACTPLSSHIFKFNSYLVTLFGAFCVFGKIKKCEVDVNDTPIPKSCFCPWEFLLMSHGGGSLGCIMCFPCKSFLSVIAIRGSDNPSPRALCRPPQDLIPPNIFHLPSSCRCSCHLMAEWKLPEADSGACIGCPHKVDLDLGTEGPIGQIEMFCLVLGVFLDKL